MPAARSAARGSRRGLGARVARRQRSLEEAAEPGDDRHHVVHFVRHAAGDPRNCLHPLGLHEDLRGAPALGDVADDASDPFGAPVGSGHGVVAREVALGGLRRGGSRRISRSSSGGRSRNTASNMARCLGKRSQGFRHRPSQVGLDGRSVQGGQRLVHPHEFELAVHEGEADGRAAETVSSSASVRSFSRSASSAS